MCYEINNKLIFINITKILMLNKIIFGFFRDLGPVHLPDRLISKVTDWSFENRFICQANCPNLMLSTYFVLILL